MRAAIIGSGNIGTDLLYKLLDSEVVEPCLMVGIDPTSEGLKRAKALGLETVSDGVGSMLRRQALPDIVFEATSARAHAENAPLYRAAGIPAVDLTPAALGPAVVPAVNLGEHAAQPNVNLLTCGAQATVPIVHAVSRVTQVEYAEIVAAVSSASAGPGTRANIDEFTRTTARGLEVIGGARRGKAIIILNPAEPPLAMRDTVFCTLAEDADTDAVEESVLRMVREVSTYVPGYHLLSDLQFDAPRPEWKGLGRVVVLIEVVGRGDYFPPYAGNLDIMTAAAARVGEEIARRNGRNQG